VSALATLNVFANPICVKCARSRLRLKHVLSWGTVCLTVTAFICMGVYLTMTEQRLATAPKAAQAMLPPLVIIQAVILILSGTGSVAGGLAQERIAGLLDYHRMTPMTPVQKILGFLFGLPVREYFLFALTLPFLAFAVIRGGFPVGPLLHFYAALFVAVWLYHLTALVAGMVTKKPRMAQILAQGLVILIYFVLPSLSLVGLSFFEYITIRPTFMRVLIDELARLDATRSLRQLGPLQELSRNVPFFETTLHPTVYGLMVQGFLLVTMFVIVRRKWIGEQRHSLSKLQGLLVFAVTLFFFMGNLWPIFAREHLYMEILEERFPTEFPLLLPFALVFLLPSGGLFLALMAIITPERAEVQKALRRARKLRLARVPSDSDGASSMPAAVGMSVCLCLAAALLVWLDHAHGRYLMGLPPVWTLYRPLLLCAALMLFVQGLRERCGTRVYLVSLFLLWMVPFFVCLVMYAAKEAFVGGTWVGLPFPPLALYLAVAELLHAAPHLGSVDEFVPPELATHLPAMNTVAALGYAVLAAAIQIERLRWMRRLASAQALPAAA
jgi:hypothetical protein